MPVESPLWSNSGRPTKVVLQMPVMLLMPLMLLLEIRLLVMRLPQQVVLMQQTQQK